MIDLHIRARHCLAAAIAFLICAAPAIAQMPRFMQVGEPATAREAFATPYGQRMIDELAKALGEKASPGCLAEKKIAPAALRGHAETLLDRFGQLRIDRLMALVVADKADAEFVRLAGAAAHDEWRALLADTHVAEYDRRSRAAKLLQIADMTVENIDRYVLLSRIDLRSLSPISTGDPDLNELREQTEDQSVEAAETYRDANDTPAMQRFMQMSLWAQEALLAGLDQETLLKYGPRDIMPGLDDALREVCLGSR